MGERGKAGISWVCQATQQSSIPHLHWLVWAILPPINCVLFSAKERRRRGLGGRRWAGTGEGGRWGDNHNCRGPQGHCTGTGAHVQILPSTCKLQIYCRRQAFRNEQLHLWGSSWESRIPDVILPNETDANSLFLMVFQIADMHLSRPSELATCSPSFHIPVSGTRSWLREALLPAQSSDLY